MKKTSFVQATIAMLAACACTSQKRIEPAVDPSSQDGPAATEGKAAPVAMSEETQAVEAIEVAIASRSGSALVGVAQLTEVEDGVRVVVRVDQAEPGLHGVHIHENADCSADDASSAGGHFNPEGNEHGLPPSDRRHLGDLGNMGTTAPDGKGLLETTVLGANLRPDHPHSFLGRALVVHANEDKGVQPAGGAGDRVGCAEITMDQNRI